MKKILFVLSILFSNLCLSHEGGHGPVLSDESMNGGRIAPVILEKEIPLERKAKMLYKAELVHASRKTQVKVFLYSVEMKELELKDFGETLSAIQIEESKEKPFTLKLDKSGKFYVGQRPRNKRVPFSIDVKIKGPGKQLFAAFDGLD